MLSLEEVCTASLSPPSFSLISTTIKHKLLLRFSLYTEEALAI